MLKVLLIYAQPLVTVSNKKLCIDKDLANNLEVFLSCRLISLGKNTGLRPIFVGEVLRRTGPLQVCAGQEPGCEAAVHDMSKMYKEEHTEAVLLVDTANAFNFVNRKIFLHNIKVVCPSISIYVQNC